MTDDYLERARADWDRRAKKDHVRYTASATSPEEYEARGRRDADLMVELLTEAGARWGSGLEIGCGSGRLLKRLAPRFKSMHGTDISPEMIEQARRDVPGVTYHLVDGPRVPVEGLDVIYCHSVFHHVPRTVMREYVAEVRRALAPGGAFLFQLTRPYTFRRRLKAFFRVEPGASEPWSSRYYTWRELRSMAEGFRVARERTDDVNMLAVWVKP